jgi:hypothetical protein
MFGTCRRRDHMKELCVADIMRGRILEVPMYVSYFVYASPVQGI